MKEFQIRNPKLGEFQGRTPNFWNAEIRCPSLKFPQFRISDLRFLIFLAFLLFAPSAFAEYRTFNLESLRITFDSTWAAQGAQGYFPVRFDITNLGEAREIVLNVTQQHWFDMSRVAMSRGRGMSFSPFDMGGIDIRQTISLKRGDTKQITVPLPVFADNESFQFRFRERGREIDGFAIGSSFQSARSAAESPVLFVTQQNTPLGAIVTPRPIPTSRGWYPGGPMMGGRAPSSPELDFFLEPARLPNNWLGYTALLAVVVPASEWSQLKPAQQDALLNWTAAGGDFFLVDGAIETILPTSQRLIGLPDQPGVLPYFFGHIHLLTSAIISQQGWENAIPNAVVSTSIANFALPANRARDWSWIADRGFRLPIPGVGQIPTRAYLLILVLFLFLIGPVNYVYLWRKKRQVLIVLTVPLLSLTFMMLLSGYALLSQGLDVRARAATFTVLDQASKRAATRSSVSLYPGGLMPSGGVQFTGDTAVFPLGTDGLGQRSRMSLDLTNNQSFRSGLLRSRAPANFDQIRVQAARERLSFENSGNEMRVVNGLGARVLQLLYRDGERWWTLDAPLAMGDQTKLTVRTNSKPLNFAELIKDTLVDSGKFQEVASIQPDQTYLALLDSSPFWEAGVIEPTEHESFHLVLGYPEKQQ